MIVIVGALLIFVIDQITKIAVQLRLFPGQSIPIVPGIFHLTYVQNPGAAFGILAHRTTFFIVVTTLIIGIVVYFSYRMRHSATFLLKLGLALQLGGALGNLVDRMRLGYVIDFFDFRIWPVFNVADIGIVVGVTLLAYHLIWVEQ